MFLCASKFPRGNLLAHSSNRFCDFLLNGVIRLGEQAGFPYAMVIAL